MWTKRLTTFFGGTGLRFAPTGARHARACVGVFSPVAPTAGNQYRRGGPVCPPFNALKGEHMGSPLRLQKNYSFVTFDIIIGLLSLALKYIR